MTNYLEHVFDGVDASIKLDEEQKKVIITEGDLEVIAGAGSGKTTTIVAKVKYLIDVKNIDPSRILLISYTNKATEELKARIQKDFALPISILTFHKLGLQLISQIKSVDIQNDFNSIIGKLIQKQRKKERLDFYFIQKNIERKMTFQN